MKDFILPTDELNQIIKETNKKFNGFSGNCAKFATVLNKVLGGDDMFILVEGGHYEYVDHIALKWGHLVIDGDGIVTEEEFEEKYTDEENETTFDVIEDDTDDKRYIKKMVDQNNIFCRHYSEEEMEEYLKLKIQEICNMLKPNH